MKKANQPWLPMLSLLALGILISGCSSTPKLTLKPGNGEDRTGAMKYQLWTGYIHIAPVATRDEKKPGIPATIDLQGVVARNPYKPTILMDGRDEFFSSTKLTYAPVKNTMLPEKVTVAVEDKTEKRIEQAGEFAKAVIPLFFLAAPTAQDKQTQDPYEKAIANFDPWTINLAPALDSGKLKKGKTSLNEGDGIGANPKDWEYTLDIDPVSKTAVDIGSMKEEELAAFLDSLGDRGVLVYPSCRTATLMLTYTYKGANKEKKWTQSFQIPDPRWVETAKLPIKGSMIFHECSVAVEPGDQDQRDNFAIAVKLATTAKSVWEAHKDAAEKAAKK
jgi:hypothetical protein